MLRNTLNRIAVLVLAFAAGTNASAQTTPPEGIRDNTPAVHAITNARIVQAPGKVIERGTLVIRDGVIVSVGTGKPPDDALVWDMKGMSIYPGIIDLSSDYGIPKQPSQRGGQDDQPQKPAEEIRGAQYWNDQVRANQRAATLFRSDEKAAEKLRSQGITTVLSIPGRGIFRGISALVHTGVGTPNELILRDAVAHHVTFERDPGGEGYPQSLMGSIALVRQTFLDAGWYAAAHAAQQKNPSLSRPEANEALDALGSAATGGMQVIFDTRNERDLFRVDAIAREFKLDAAVHGSGNEYKRLDAVKKTGRSIILPLTFPDVPEVGTSEDALDVSLAELRQWDEAPENPARLRKSGVTYAFTASGLKENSTFLTRIRQAVARGLSPEDALAAMTTTPARMCGMEKQLGSLETGKIADFIVADGDLFDKKSKIRETWIDGHRYPVNPLPVVDVRGVWDLSVPGRSERGKLALKGEGDAPGGTITWKKDIKLSSVSLSGLRLSFSYPGDSAGTPGSVRFTGIVSQTDMEGTGEMPDGSAFSWSATRTAPYTPEPDTTKPEEVKMASFAPVYPPGEFGRAALPDRPNVVFVKNATIWTSGPDGKIENGNLLVEKGIIKSVGKNIDAPGGAVIIDGTGKHVTPGMIDAHSHMAGDGALNEAGQAISAEVRIGDVIDSDEINIYRGLAGGLTAAHVLHGSANPIGGQSQLIKLRWGMGPEEMKFEGAPPTIKFALGENVKQSNWGERYTTRYPQTRMGVEQIMRDEFNAALDYERAWKEYGESESGIPPRKDLELETIVEILRGKRFVHCHSYRQDEILAMMRVAEDFGFRIRVFQHILEGYKVADIMAEHGAGGSSFTDWWAYKFEVYDAIPYNGALMHQEGVLVSFNSDSDELSRRLNTEAAKAVKWGGIPEEEALKFVTINPAKQLMVDKRVGSLEPGKDADFVIWNGSPLSTYTMCEQTWIDGRKYFDREEDRRLNEDATRQRAVLIQKAIAAKPKGGGGPPKKEGPGSYDDDEPYSCTGTEEGH